MQYSNASLQKEGSNLINSIARSVGEAASSVKVAASTSIATAGTGAAAWLEWIPSDIGKLATLIGVILSSILIYAHIKKLQRDKELHAVEMAKKTLELEILQSRAKEA